MRKSLFVFALLVCLSIALPCWAGTSLTVSPGRITADLPFVAGNSYTLPTYTVTNPPGGGQDLGLKVNVSDHKSDTRTLPPANWFSIVPSETTILAGTSTNVQVRATIPANAQKDNYQVWFRFMGMPTEETGIVNAVALQVPLVFDLVAATGQSNVNFTIGSGGGGGGGGGGTVTTQPVSSTTGSASITPSAGGTVGLGNEASVTIPANALQGTVGLQVSVQKVDTPPAAPSGFMILGTVYQFTVGTLEHYTFNKPVTLTFAFDPSTLQPGEQPAVYYYDETAGQWVNIGGTVSGGTITVTVGHFTKYAVIAEKKVVQPPAPIVLTDIGGHWAEADINKLVTLGAINGYPDKTFKPENSITRAEFAAVLARAMGWQESPDAAKFGDNLPAWAKGSIGALVEKSVTKGYEDNTFRPDQPITRAEMVVMIVRALGLEPSTMAPSFADSADIPAWARGYVSTATSQGVIKGKPGNIFAPIDNSTRAETAVVIVNMLDKLGI